MHPTHQSEVPELFKSTSMGIWSQLNFYGVKGAKNPIEVSGLNKSASNGRFFPSADLGVGRPVFEGLLTLLDSGDLL